MSLKNLSAEIKIPKFLKDKLFNNKINQIYKRFEKDLNINEDFVVGVSGGPDSLALSFLTKIYAIKKRLKPRFFIVDHRLRIDSSKEAKFVKKLLKKLSINAEILILKGKKPSKNIQSFARVKRYELLFKKCDEYKIKNIILGHHQDDLFENFFIRLLRGSGLKGLISLDQKIKIEDKYLFRPLLNQEKKDLIYVSKQVFNFFLEDPTNYEDKYLRIRIRKLIKDLEINGLDKRKFKKTINNLKSSNDVINYYVNQNLIVNSSSVDKSKKLILNENFFMQPSEVVFRSFSQSLKIVSNKYYPARGKKIDIIIRDIKNNQSLKKTLGGCIIEKFNQTVIISEE